MRILMIINTIVFALVGGYVVAVGLDLRKWSSWLYGLYGFFSGFVMGIYWSNLCNALFAGVLCSFVILFGGATSRWHNERWGTDD